MTDRHAAESPTAGLDGSNGGSEPAGFPTTSLASLGRLVVSSVAALVRPGVDVPDAVTRWLQRELADVHDEAIVLNFGVKKVLLVVGPELSADILDQPPSVRGYAAGNLKTKAMSFLAPNALTISNDGDWSRRRVYNEHVLETGRPHDHRQTFLDQVTEAFAEPLQSADELRQRMGQTMLGVVFGGHGPSDLPHQTDALMGVVQSPLQRTAMGWWHRRARRRFYVTVQRLRNQTPDASLVSRGMETKGLGDEELVEQIPHWMFTFTGSATDLLTRTLAVVAARPNVRQRVIDEIHATGSLDEAATVDKLDYLEGCLRETGRLFPPVTRTFHVAPNGAVWHGRSVPAGMEIVHYFPLHNRDTRADTSANTFRPERWLSPPTPRSNLFLSGVRACPGEDLIVFICKAALAVLLDRHGVRGRAPSLASDPVPMRYPADDVELYM